MNEQLQSRPLIEAKGLSRIFGSPENQTVALQNVNLTIPTGSFTSIMGASGSGKSTLLHLLGLLDYPTSGTYTLDGIDTGQLDEAARAHLRNQKIGFVFQSFHLLARTTVLENVMLPLAYSKVPARQHRERAEHALTQVQLSHRLDHTQGQLSGGEKQRVAMARALVNNPDIIFADEPTGNLDTKTGTAVMEIIKELHERGRTIIIITHEKSTARFAERIIRLKDGEVIADEKINETVNEISK